MFENLAGAKPAVHDAMRTFFGLLGSARLIAVLARECLKQAGWKGIRRYGMLEVERYQRTMRLQGQGDR
jgi:hypothetical protein